MHAHDRSVEPPSPPHMPPLRVITEPRAELSVLYSSFPLAIYFTHGTVHVSVLISQIFSPFPSPSPLSRCEYGEIFTQGNLLNLYKKMVYAA